ncbi:SCO family protein [bacterium]|nr:SCO family protein [bacterium]
MKANLKKDQELTLPTLMMIAWLLFFLFSFSFIAGAADINTQSLYQYKTRLINQDNQSISFNVYEGFPVVATMFYASCTYSCPVLISSLKKMESDLKPDVKKNTRFLLISMDPSNDTPTVLKKVAEEQKLDLSRWTLSSPENDNTAREIANLLGVIYRKTPEGIINHNTMINLLDKNGSPLLSEEGLTDAVVHAKEALQK